MPAQDNMRSPYNTMKKPVKFSKRLHLEVDLASSCNNIGFVYDTQKEYGLALEYYEQSLQIRQRLHLQVDLAESYTNIGGVYKAQKTIRNGPLVLSPGA